MFSCFDTFYVIKKYQCALMASNNVVLGKKVTDFGTHFAEYAKVLPY